MNESDSSQEEQDYQVLDISDDSDDSDQDIRLLNSIKQRLPFQENEEEDEDQDLEENDEENEESGWGSRKKIYYNADDVEQDEDAEKEEEEEALRIQQKFAQQMHEEDFKDEFQDSFENQVILQSDFKIKEDEHLQSDNKIEHIQHNISSLSKEERLALVNNLCPDVLDKMDQFKTLWNQMSSIQSKKKLDLGYTLLTLLQFYLYLRSKQQSLKKVENHPMNVLLEKIQELYNAFPDESLDSHSISSDPNDSNDVENEELDSDQEESLQDENEMEKDEQEEMEEDEEEYYNLIAKTKSDAKKARQERIEQEKIQQAQLKREWQDPDLIPEDAQNVKRKATWKILANKGLTPFRKKENRNPRVKKRLKYEKAIKKLPSYRRVAVDKTQLGAYSGEKTGIKSLLSRSVRFD